MDRMEYTRALRARTDIHWNCCQSVLAPFAEECGITAEEAYRIGANFGGGMKMGSVCGTVTGGLMVLGMAGKPEAAAVELKKRFKALHTSYQCVDLLRMAAEKPGFVKKVHCDGLVYEMVELLEELLSKY